MYKMKADGVVFYDPSSDDMALHVLSPKAKYELNKAGSLTFIMLPGNVMYDGLHKMKTIVTLEQDGEAIFRGRVLETATDLYNQKEVYCEGELSYLLDSMQRPYTYDGSAKDYFRLMIDNHNADVEEYKRFTVGLMTALTDEDTVKAESQDYRNTMTEIRSLLLNEFNGYLRVRWEDGVRYLDYVDKFDQACSQEINFGVNLVDIENKVNAQDICTVLIPLGRSSKGKYTPITSANDGKDYIEDAEGIAKYGRIVKSYTWDDIEDPAELLELGRKHMERMQAETTLTITAIDLHTAGTDVDGIRLGDTVKLHSVPHGLDKEDVCTKIELVIENPEKSEYTFGIPIETLTDSNASASRKNAAEASHFHRWLTETENSFEVVVEGLDSKILLQAENIENNARNIQTNAENIETNSANIKANASRIEVVSEDLLVVSNDVTVWGERIEAAAQEIDVNAARLDAMADVIGFEARASGNDDETEYVAVRLDGIEGTLTQHATTIESNATNIKTNATNIETNATDIKTNANDIEVLTGRLNLCVEDLNVYAQEVETYAEEVTTIADTVTTQGKLIEEKADVVRVEAIETQIKGLVTMEDFESVKGWVDHFASDSVEATSLSADSASIETLSAGEISTGSISTGGLSADEISINGSAAATQAWVESKGYVTASTSSLTNYYTKNEVYSADETFELIGTYLDSYSYATQDWVKNQGYLTSIPTGTLDGFVTANDVRGYCEALYATKTELSDYVLASSITKVSKYVVTKVTPTVNTSGYVTNVTYSGEYISFYT